MYRLILIAIILFYSCFGFSQITIKGRVIDENNKPIANVNIIEANANKGCFSNKDGLFYLRINSRSTEISVSHIGYITENKPINEFDISDIQDSIFNIEVVLKQEFKELSEVEISAENSKKAYSKPSIYIYDYCFVNGAMLLLLEENKQCYLRLVDDWSKTISELAIPSKPEKLFKDCFGELHICYKDSIHQLFVEYEEISTLYSFSVEDFNKSVSPCVAASGYILTVKEFGPHNQSIIYYTIGENRDRNLLKFVRSEHDELFAASEKRIIRQLETQTEGGGRSLKDDRSLFERKAFYKFILSNPIYSPLLKIRDSIYIFDHVNDSCYVYSANNSFKRSFFIQYHRSSSWAKELIVDYSKSTVYAKCIEHGVTYLKMISLLNGDIMETIKVDTHFFPENIKINDEHIYYLYKDSYVLDVQNIYKQKI